MQTKFIGGFAHFEKLDFLIKYIAPQIAKTKAAAQKILEEKFSLTEQALLREGRIINAEPEQLAILQEGRNRESLLQQEKRYAEIVQRFDDYFEKTSMGKFFRVLRITSKEFNRHFKMLEVEIQLRAREQGLPGVIVPLSDKYLELYRILTNS